MPAPINSTTLLAAINAAVEALNNIDESAAPDIITQLTSIASEIQSLDDQGVIGIIGESFHEDLDLDGTSYLRYLQDISELDLNIGQIGGSFPNASYTSSPPDAEKCLASRRVVGLTVSPILYLRRVWPVLGTLVALEAALVGILGETIMVAAAGSLGGAIAQVVQQHSQFSMDDLYNDIVSLRESWVCAIYSSVRTEEAENSIININNNSTIIQEHKDILNVLWENATNIVDRGLHDPFLLSPAKQYGSEWGEWSTFDCATCATPGSAPSPCADFPSTNFYYGTPELFSDGEPQSGTYTSEWDGGTNKVGNVEMTEEFSVRITHLSHNGISFSGADCGSVNIYGQTIDISDLPLTFRVSQFQLSNPLQIFSVTLEFV